MSPRRSRGLAQPQEAHARIRRAVTARDTSTVSLYGRKLPLLIWSSPLFGAAGRVMRGVAGRRALPMALLVGGVFALGLLCGQRAQAAESVPSSVTSAEAGSETGPAVGSTGSTGGSAASPATTRVTGAVASAVPSQEVTAGSAERTDQPTTEPAATSSTPSAPVSPDTARNALRPTGAQSGEPAGQGAKDLTEALADGLRNGAEPVADGLRDGTGRVADGLEEGGECLRDGLGGSLGGIWGEADDVPPRPTWPALPPAATFPVLPPLTALPLLPLPLPAPVTGTPAPGGPADPAPADGSGGDEPSADAPEDTVHSRRAQAAPAATTWHRVPGQRPAPDAHVAPLAPFPQAPGGEPDGMLGHRAATDGAGSRYGDALALTPTDRAPFALVPGAAVHADAAETRDRYREIPVSPA